MAVDLMEFCGTRREEYGRPFALDGHVVATDGQIMVCVPEWDGELAAADKAPSAWCLDRARELLFGDWAAEPVPIPDEPEIRWKTCWECKGSGHGRGCCPTCGTTGAVPDPNRQCARCEGSGKLRDGDRVIVAGVDFSTYLLGQIRAIGVTEMAPPREEADRQGTAWRFGFPGGIGCIMSSPRRLA